MYDFFKSKTYSYIYIISLVLFLCNCTLESAEISLNVTKITQQIDLGLQIFFSITILIKFTQFSDQHAFWILLDIVTNVSAYIAYGMRQHEEEVARYFSAIKILRLLMIVKESSYLQVPA